LKNFSGKDGSAPPPRKIGPYTYGDNVRLRFVSSSDIWHITSCIID